MAKATRRKEIILEFPLSKLEHMNGLALDFGGSVCKIAYLSKEDWKDGKPVSGDLGKIRLTSFSRETFEEGIEFLKKNCFMRRNSEDDKPLVYTCGFGANQFGSKFEDELQIRTLNVAEMDCYAAALKYFVENTPLDDFCIPIPKEATEKAKAAVRQTRKVFTEMTEKGLANVAFNENLDEMLNKEYDPAANLKPYLVASAGSGWPVFRFSDDGKQSLVTLSELAGKSFLGLGCILTGAKTYEELMDLAEKGNQFNLDLTYGTLAPQGEGSKQEDDLYTGMKQLEPRPVMLWGQGIGKYITEFKKEDLACTLLYSLCTVLVTNLIDSCFVTRVKHVFVGGGFVSHPLTQKIVMEEFEHKRWGAASSVKELDADYHLHILKHSTYQGALGAFLQPLCKK